MIDLNRAKKAFKEYVKAYDINNGRIRVKIEHTYKVAENSKQIAKSLNLNEEEQKLAELIGLLHDIGRFEQIRIYNTYLDSKSIDHATQGIITLFEEGKIRNFTEEKKYDDIIYKAIENHNKLKINENLSEKEKLFAKIIRDADKLDIFRVVTTEDLKDAVAFESKDISEEVLSEQVYQSFKNKKMISYHEMKSNIDHMVVWIAYIYDLYFRKSFEMLKENQYINKIINRVDYKDLETKKKMLEIGKIANQYIEQKIK